MSNDFVSAIDILPTLAGFAGSRLPGGAVQGQDFFGPAYRPRTHIFAARDRMDISIDKMRAVRTNQFKYIRNYYPAIPYQQHNPYKETNYPTWNLVKQWYSEGKLNTAQALFASPVKPHRGTVQRRDRSRRGPQPCKGPGAQEDAA